MGRKRAEHKPTGTDWERVKCEAAQDAPVSFDTMTDADQEPYDPNDAAVVAAYWNVASIKRGVVKR